MDESSTCDSIDWFGVHEILVLNARVFHEARQSLEVLLNENYEQDLCRLTLLQSQYNKYCLLYILFYSIIIYFALLRIMISELDLHSAQEGAQVPYCVLQFIRFEVPSAST